VLVEAVPQCLQFVLVFLTIRGPTDVWIAALLQCAAAAGTIVIASIMVARDRLAWDLSLKGVGQAIKGGTPFFVERLCLTLYQTATPLFIAAFAVKEQAAYYSVGDKFLQFLGGLSIPLTYALLPNISRRVAAENANWGLSIRVVTIVSVSTCLLALASFLGAKWIILLLFRAEYAAAIPVARCFCFAACLVSYNACIANFILVPGGRSRVLIATSISALVLSLGSQVVLLPRYGALGSAVSRAIAEIGVAIILTLVATRLIAGREPKLGIQK
jgi:O-antigen/teichoic acid export membrane protein